LIAAQIEVLRAQELAADGLRDLVNRQFELDQAVAAERKQATIDQAALEVEIETVKQQDLNALRVKGVEDFKIQQREITQTVQEGADADLAIQQAKNKAIRDSTADLFGGIAALAGQDSVFGKAAAIAQATINTFEGATQVLTSKIPFPANLIAVAAVIANGLANVQKILAVPLPQVQVVESSFAEGGILSGRSHRQGGIRAGGVEFEGGEAVINKRSTRMFKDILSNINFAGGGKRFQVGGVTSNLTIPSIDTQFQLQQFEELQRAVREQQVVAIVEDITNLQTQIDVREDRANLG